MPSIHPAEGVQDWDPNRVSWRSITTGDTDGIIVTLEAQADTLSGGRHATRLYSDQLARPRGQVQADSGRRG